MATAVRLDDLYDDTNIPGIVRGALVLTAVQAVCVVAVSLINRSFEGVVDHALTGLVVAIGAAFMVFYPGIRTHPRTIEGISGAAGIGLASTWFFVPLDALILQSFHLYTNRWHEIGGGSIWWYIPVWWMVGTYLSWMGAWILANQAAKSGEYSIPAAAVLVVVCTALCGAIAAMTHFPGAGWGVGTFSIALLPGLALATVVSALSAKRG